MKKEVLSSPIRWAGSKKRVLNEMLESFSKKKNNYIEPFLGSGVVMLNVINNIDELKYENIYVNDINKNIIDFYKKLKTKPKELIEKLKNISIIYNEKTMAEKEEYFYEIRSRFNSTLEDKTVFFYFLMKVGFNGVYRENKRGEYNVPFGKKEKFIVQEEYLLKISKLIKNVHFYNLSYDKFLDKIQKKGILYDSFVYCDPPYIPDDKLISQKQELYTSGSFNHFEFSNKMHCYKKNSTDILISMSQSTLADKIYGNTFYQKKLLDIFRTINPKKMFKSSEVLYSNYKIN